MRTASARAKATPLVHPHVLLDPHFQPQPQSALVLGELLGHRLELLILLPQELLELSDPAQKPRLFRLILQLVAHHLMRLRLLGFMEPPRTHGAGARGVKSHILIADVPWEVRLLRRPRKHGLSRPNVSDKDGVAQGEAVQ